ncbi:MAG: AAA family ATPase [Bacteroidales bacterium]
MKILAIKGKNLASLEGEFEINFTVEPLRSAGIFAITGSTGSGKSTLLDALCLALFDDTPRTNRISENISMADVKDKTINQKDSRNILRRGTSDGYAEVDFVSLGSEKFRSHWSVRRSRDKVDGSLQSTELKLMNLTTHSEIQGRKTELLSKIVELIGLTFDQFTRAVLLAQGDFATFLKAKQSEKAELLEKLTGTDIYSRISASIYEKSKNAEQDLNFLRERIKDIELLSDEKLETYSIEKQEILQEIESLNYEITQLTAKIKWITEEELLNNGVKQAEKWVLNSQKAIVEACSRYDYIARIDSVQEIRDHFNELKNEQKQLIENKSNLAKYQLEHYANASLLQQVIEKVATCEVEQKKHHENYIKIEPQIKQARALDIRIEVANNKFEETEKEYKQAIEAKNRIEKTIESILKEIEMAEQLVVKIKIWFEKHESYKEIIPRIDLIFNLLEDAIMANKQGLNNAHTLSSSNIILENETKQLSNLVLEAERLNHLLPTEIVLLRAKLEENVPCPVCGSIHHPLANLQGDNLEEKELDKAKKMVHDKITTLAENLEKRKNENIRLQSVIDSYTLQSKEAMTKLNGYLASFPEWQQQLEKGVLQQNLTKMVENWNKCTIELTKTNEQITKLKTTLQLEDKNSITALHNLTEKKQKYESCVNELEELKSERAEILSGKDADKVEYIYTSKSKDITDQLAKLTLEKGEFTAKNEKCSGIIVQLSSHIAKLSEHCEVLQKQLDHWLLARKGTVTMAQLSELLSKNSHWLVTEREALNRLWENKTISETTLKERMTILKRHHEADIKQTDEKSQEALESSLSEKNTVLQQKHTRHTEIELLFANHEKGKEKIKVFEKELEEKELLTANWKKLNELFGSADGAKFKVLAQGYTLEALLTYANKHLQELSKRYELQRIPNTLALQVVDLDMLGKVRAVHSLSGGESFLISLALALGLSSLSSNRMKVESLFIDEGFGSLDIDTLRIAMDALEHLQTQGRKIGIISHVAEMTERITTQIKVVKTVNGRSKIEIV